MNIGDEFLIDVKGYIMCAKVDNGKYRMKISEHCGSLTGRLYKPKGRKLIVEHYLDQLMIMNNNNMNNNGTVIIKKLE